MFYRSIKGREALLLSFEWALPFGGIPILSVVSGSTAAMAGARPFDVITTLTCDISGLSFSALPSVPGSSWKLIDATHVEFDVTEIDAQDFARIFRSLLGNPIFLSAVRSNVPPPR